MYLIASITKNISHSSAFLAKELVTSRTMRWFNILSAALLIGVYLSAVAANTAVKQPTLKGRAPVLPPAAYLKTNHYLKSCPKLENIIHQKVNAWIKKDYTLAAAIIRLHFHDCAVRVCNL